MKTRGRRGFSRRRRAPMQWYATTTGYNPLGIAPNGGFFTGTAGRYPAQLVATLIDTSEAAIPSPPAIDRMTLLCIRGQLNYFVTIAAGGASRFTNIAFGIALLTTNSAGTLVLPDPSDARDAGQDWLFLDHRQFQTENIVANTVPVQLGNVDVFVKSKRVIREDQKLVCVAAASATAAADSFQVGPALRCLISRVA